MIIARFERDGKILIAQKYECYQTNQHMTLLCINIKLYHKYGIRLQKLLLDFNRLKEFSFDRPTAELESFE